MCINTHVFTLNSEIAIYVRFTRVNQNKRQLFSFSMLMLLTVVVLSLTTQEANSTMKICASTDSK